MMFQTVIPTTRSGRQALKNIFIGGRTEPHVLVEWLDEGMRYKYMLTGCARKRSQNEVRLPGFEEIGLN